MGADRVFQFEDLLEQVDCRSAVQRISLLDRLVAGDHRVQTLLDLAGVTGLLLDEGDYLLLDILEERGDALEGPLAVAGTR